MTEVGFYHLTRTGPDRALHGFSLNVVFSDGSTVNITPTRDVPETAPDSETKSAEPDEAAIADWEIMTPHQRVVVAGPGHYWGFLDSSPGGSV